MAKNLLFGTDGIRGTFDSWPLTRQVIFQASSAAAIWLKKKKKGQLKVIIGRDTRASCKNIENLLAAGFRANGAEVYSAGVIPTPGLAFLASTMDVDLGVMISASHNPAQDNGIKFFKHNGFKLSEQEESQIEKIIFPRIRKPAKIPAQRKKIKMLSANPSAYIEHLKKSAGNLDLTGFKVALDCANGASCGYAQKLFRSLGAKVVAVSKKPDGRNINLHCGSLHPQKICALTRKHKADVGFAFDGDADRVMISDEKGEVRDGDYVMAAVAKNFSKNGKLGKNTVITTSMSNFGLESYLARIGVGMVRTDVGDKFVLQEIIKRRANFGGEQSGHLIFFDHATTGDGILSALMFLKLMKDERAKASSLAPGFRKLPQLIHNIRVKEKRDFAKMPRVRQSIDAVHKLLSGKGRLVVRYSGTEKLARVMVEGKSRAQIKKLAETIGREIEKEIGC